MLSCIPLYFLDTDDPPLPLPHSVTGKLRHNLLVVAAMIGMIWTAMAYDEHGQQFAEMRSAPRCYYDIKSRPDENLWVEAFDKEIRKLFKMGTFSIVDESEIPHGHTNISCCMSFKIKKDGDDKILEYCARCNTDGR